MSFIRVTRKDSKAKVDLNTNHIVSFQEAEGGGAYIELVTGNEEQVNESARQLRSFVKKAQGLLPVSTATTEDEQPAAPVA